MEISLAPSTIAGWQDLIQEALQNRSFSLNEELESYLVFLLMRFTTDSNLASSILALEYLESQALNGQAKQQQLRDVGDKCLLFGGFYPEQAHRRLVSFEYFVNIGRSAYHQIAQDYNSNVKINITTINDDYNSHLGNTNKLFENLALNFVKLLDVLHQIRYLDKNNNWLLDEITKFEKQKLQQQEKMMQKIITNNPSNLH